MAKDKESRREARAADRQSIADITASMHMNLDDTLMHLANVRSGTAPEKAGGSSNSLIDKRADQTYVAGKKIAQEHINWDSVLSRAGYQPQAQPQSRRGGPAYDANANTISIALSNRAMETFQPVVNELNRFKFASSDEKRDEQLGALLLAVKTAVQRVAIREVAANTKRFYDNAVKFSQIENTSGSVKGMKVIYKVASANVVVTAEGEFFGDEIVCLEQDGASATAYVARQVGNEFEDITGRYAMKLELAQ
jgi:hypothetical protein